MDLELQPKLSQSLHLYSQSFERQQKKFFTQPPGLCIAEIPVHCTHGVKDPLFF